MSLKRKLFNKGDIILVATALLIVVLFYLFNEDNHAATAEIIFDGRVLETVLLSNERTFYYAENQQVVFKIQNNSICFYSSDCPDNLCVNTGYIMQKGQFAACLPNKFAIRILSEGTGGVRK